MSDSVRCDDRFLRVNIQKGMRQDRAVSRRTNWQKRPVRVDADGNQTDSLFGIIKGAKRSAHRVTLIVDGAPTLRGIVQNLFLTASVAAIIKFGTG
jgi:hypothetical protein